jgi:hypothetical protein
LWKAHLYEETTHEKARLKELKAAQTVATKAQVNAQKIAEEVTMTPNAAVGVSRPTRT